jgi:hypothetical protein
MSGPAHLEERPPLRFRPAVLPRFVEDAERVFEDEALFRFEDEPELRFDEADFRLDEEPLFDFDLDEPADFDFERDFEPDDFVFERVFEPDDFDFERVFEPDDFDFERVFEPDDFDFERDFEPDDFDFERDFEPDDFDFERDVEPDDFDLDLDLEPEDFDFDFDFEPEAFDFELDVFRRAPPPPREPDREPCDSADPPSPSSDSSSSEPISFLATPTAAGIATPSAVPATTFCVVESPSSSSFDMVTFPHAFHSAAHCYLASLNASMNFGTIRSLTTSGACVARYFPAASAASSAIGSSTSDAAFQLVAAADVRSDDESDRFLLLLDPLLLVDP